MDRRPLKEKKQPSWTWDLLQTNRKKHRRLPEGKEKMKYEIIYLDGLYCVFKNDRIVSAFDTKEKAKEAIKQYRTMKGEKK